MLRLLTGVETFYDGGGVYQVPPAEHADQVRVQVGDGDPSYPMHSEMNQKKRNLLLCYI